jgi:group I intron endonuclease
MQPVLALLASRRHKEKIIGYAIYIVTNVVNAKQYVGITNNLERRWRRHKKAFGETPLLHRSIKKYGIDAFVFSHIADAFDRETAFDLERILIEQHNTFHPNGLNLTKGGEGGSGAKLGRVLSQETKDKISASLVGKPSPRKGVILTEETKRKLSESKMGKPSNRVGYKHSEETIAKIKAKKIARDLFKKLKEYENV